MNTQELIDTAWALVWQGAEANALAAQQALYHRAWCNQAARRGEYHAAMEKT